MANEIGSESHMADIFDSILCEVFDPSSSIEGVGVIPSPLQQGFPQRLAAFQESDIKLLCSSPFDIKIEDQHQGKMTEPLVKKRINSQGSTQVKKDQLISDCVSKFQMDEKELEDEFLFYSFEEIENERSRGSFFDEGIYDFPKSEKVVEEMVDERESSLGQFSDDIQIKDKKQDYRLPQKNVLLDVSEEKIGRPSPKNLEQKVETVQNKTISDYQQKRQAEKLFGDYLVQVLRKTMKKLKILVQQSNIFTKNQQKSKKYLLFLLSELNKKKLLSESFFTELKRNLSARLGQIKEKNQNRQVFFKEFEIEFSYFQRAVKELADGDLEKSIEVLFGRNESPRRLHQKTILAMKEAKQALVGKP